MADSVPREQFEQLLEMNRVLVETVRTLAGGNVIAREVTATSVDQAISRHHPTRFDGSGSPTELEDWIREMEKVFEAIQCLGDMKVEQAAFYLSGKTDLWWHNHRGPLRAMLTARGERCLGGHESCFTR